MNTRLATLACLALLLLGSTAHAAVYATGIDFQKGVGAIESARLYTANALGSYAKPSVGPVANIDFLSLGLGGSAVFSFGGATFKDYVTVYETTWGRPNDYKEYAEIYGGMQSDPNSNAWVKLGEFYNQSVDSLGGHTFAFSGVYQYLMIKDITLARNGVKGDGFDVNAVAVNPTPVPGAAWLLGSGLFGLFGLRRRFC